MQNLTESMSRWTTEELLDEVIRRSASDGPALQLLEMIVLRARLAEGDRRLGGRTQPKLASAAEFAGVGGTIEMGLAAGEK
jgi:hypothetical protein